MGKVTFDPLQQLVIEEFKKDEYLKNHFYFTGGTALSIYYLQHRLSEDLDFFTQSTFLAPSVIAFISKFEDKYGFRATLRQPEGTDILIFTLEKNRKNLKIDFNYYPFERVEKGKIVDGVDVDSLRDIGANKLLTVNQRTDVKDFVDLYFLLQTFTVWDLLYAVEAKFRMKMEIVMIASDFMKVEEFKSLPKMLRPFKLSSLYNFFLNQAKKLGQTVVK